MVHGRRPGSEQSNPRQAQYHLVQRGACRLGQQHAHPGGQEQQGDHLWFGQLTIIVHPAEGEALYPPSPIHVRLLTIPGDGKGS